MVYSHYMLIPLNHLKIQEIIDLSDRITIFPNYFFINNKMLSFSKKGEEYINYRNFVHYSNDFQAMKFMRHANINDKSFYELSYAYIKYSDEDLKSHDDKLNFIHMTYAIIRVLDILSFKYEEKDKLWSEWQKPYEYSSLAFSFNDKNVVEDVLEITLNKLCLDVDKNILNKNFSNYIELFVKNIKSKKLIKIMNLYNKIYGYIIYKDFQDANLLSIILLEYLFCDERDELKSKKIINELSKFLEKDCYSNEGIEKIITKSYRERSKNVHKYKGLDIKSLYNFSLYYFNALESLLDNDEIDLFNLFLLVNYVVIYEINCLTK